MASRQRSENRQRTCLIALRCTPQERARLFAAATAAEVSLSGYVRDAALTRARSA